MGVSTTKRLALIGLMGGLGNVLFLLSQFVFNAGQIKLDLSHVGTLVAAIYAGPWVGMMTGLVVGTIPGLYFGYIGGSLGLLGLLGLPIGKALTGYTVGALSRMLRIGTREKSSILAVMLVPIFVPMAAPFLLPLLAGILIKAWIEIFAMSFYMGATVGNSGFSNFIRNHFLT
jgi:riboflavin transporter FmnP